MAEVTDSERLAYYRSSVKYKDLLIGRMFETIKRLGGRKFPIPPKFDIPDKYK